MAHQSLSCQETGSTVRTTEFALKLLERITNHFSEESIIGRGGSGIVYKGVLDNGEEIAIKKLYKMPGLDDKEFTNEFNNLMRARHKNIMRLIGYCYSLAHECLPHDGKYVFALLEERLLCYEYLHGGSLDERLSDESCGLDWHKRFTIIKGVCEGLNFLHNIPEGPIYHLDLKPANVLLDNNMLPKIGDFGLSRLFTSAETQITTKIRGTLGYMPPEYIERGEITSKFDIFSLGVILIQVIAGREGYVKFGGMAPQEFSKLVHENWAKRPHATMSSRTWQEIKTCMDMALKCVETDGVKRPYINEIIDKLSNIGSGDNTSELDKVDGDIVNEPAEKSGGDNNVDEQHKVDDDGDIVYKLDELDTDHIADEDEDKLDAAKSSPMGQSPRCHGRQGCRLLPTDRMDSLFSTRCVWVNGPVIVGGGPSGLAVAAALREQGTPFVVLEREDCIASLWQKRTYHNLKLNWAKQLCELPRMPFPDDYPEYLTCRQFIDYLETYACKFDVKPLFNTTVLSARYDESSGLWRVRAAPTQGDGAEMEYISRWLVVATSQNAEKIVPCIPGLHSFRGEVIHSSDYRSGEAYKGKRVLVVGCGHSGMEVSLDLCDNAAIPFMVVRDVLGFSTLCLTVVLMRWLPLLLLDKIMLFLAWLLLGELARFGIRTPAVDPLTLKKTYGRIWCSTARKIRSSEMNVVPGVMRFTKSGVELSDGIFLDVDAVVLATGYHNNVPQWLQGTDFPSNGWKGQNGLFSVGFSGASADAMCIAKDLGHLWKEETVRNKQKCAVTRWRRSDQTFGLAKPIAWKL